MDKRRSLKQARIAALATWMFCACVFASASLHAATGSVYGTMQYTNGALPGASGFSYELGSSRQQFFRISVSPQ